MCLDLPAKVFHLHKPRLERHDQGALQLVFGPVELSLRHRALVDGTRAELQFAGDDVDDTSIEAGMDRGRNAKEARVGVTVMKGSAVVDAMMLIEHVGVEARVHTLARTTSAEAASSAKENLKRSKGVDVVVVNAEAFECDINVSEFEVGLRNV
jgi:hypothetical protein